MSQEDLHTADVKVSEKKLEPASGKKTVQRREWIDYARGIATLLVVFGHVAAGFKNVAHNGAPLDINYLPFELTSVVYYARMPLFFIISGIYIRRSFEKRGLAPFARNKFDTIFYPYLIWATIQFIFQLIGYQYGVSNSPREAADILYLFVRPDQMDQFWFLYALFSTSMVYALLVHFAKFSSKQILAIASLLYIVFYYLPNEAFLFGFKYVCKFLFYLSLGDLTASYLLNEKNRPLFASLKVTAILVGLFVLIRYIMTAYDIPEYEKDFFSWQNVMLLICIFTGLAMILNLSFAFEKFQILKWLKVVGTYSLYIYTMHIIINGIARYVILKLTNYQVPNLALYIVTALAIVLPIILYKLMNRAGLWFLYNPRKENAAVPVG